MDEKTKEAIFYILTIATYIVAVSVIFAGCQGFEFNRQFYEQDPRYSYYRSLGDTVGTTELILLCLLIPFFCVILVVGCFVYAHGSLSRTQKAIEVVLLMFSYFGAIGVSGLAQATLSTIFDEPRPSLFYLCNYQGFRDAVDSGNFDTYISLTSSTRLGDTDNCYDQDYIPNAMRGFPSGHASFAFSAMFWLILFFIHFSKRYSWMKYFQCLLWLPIILATWIAYSRVYDYQHSELDVTAGALLGMGAAYYFFEEYLDFFNKRWKKENNDLTEPLMEN
jgi:membrane-associated phospholipid phosphatase